MSIDCVDMEVARTLTFFVRLKLFSFLKTDFLYKCFAYMYVSAPEVERGVALPGTGLKNGVSGLEGTGTQIRVLCKSGKYS